MATKIVKLKKCSCGSEAEIVGDDDGFVYVICNAECGHDPAWANHKDKAVKEWNEMIDESTTESRGYS